MKRPETLHPAVVALADDAAEIRAHYAWVSDCGDRRGPRDDRERARRRFSASRGKGDRHDEH